MLISLMRTINLRLNMTTCHFVIFATSSGVGAVRQIYLAVTAYESLGCSFEVAYFNDEGVKVTGIQVNSINCM
jgi:hypothetical protein